ncbi:MAG: hypothetical protein V2A69_15660 [Pseudomonadota bacterium]
MLHYDLSLGLGNVSMALSRLKPSMKGVSTVYTLGGPQEMIMVSEAGDYKLAFTSRKPEIDVLPSLRKFGAYMHPMKRGLTI